ncbi:hypothetical protein ABXT06_01550 [Flavobacterium sp. UW10123]|uniref:hypothetical protein n=1 Tax=Flavobacterium sp. UW10123 TaxID=3230800 RepID=UPI0033941EEF
MKQINNSHVLNLLEVLKKTQPDDLSIIPWSTPILSFGNILKSKIATLGINPSNREFVDLQGLELKGDNRRFHTLNSLEIKNWSEIKEKHINLIIELCDEYFLRNPYDGWFKKLDYLISGTSMSYYFPSQEACHLDLIPFATFEKWSNLTPIQQNTLLNLFSDFLGILIAESSIEIILLNGQTVVNNFEKISNLKLYKTTEKDWELPRKKTENVAGYSYQGYVETIGTIDLKRKVKVLGYNHNIQSSFGVTSQVQTSIRKWITLNINEYSYETS